MRRRISLRFVANELALEHQYIPVDLRKREQLHPEFIKMHPAAKVPVIDDNGFILFESGAIIRYLAAKHKSPLYPEALTERALVDQWIDFLTSHVRQALGRLTFNRVFAPKINIQVDERSIEDGMRFLNRYLPVLEGQLTNSPFMAGETLSLADMVFVAILDPCEVSGVDLSPFPSLVQHRNNLMTQPFYTKCHKCYADTLTR